MYANDVLLYSYIKSESDCHALQEGLDALALWARIWQMEFNPSRCEFLRITNKKNPIVFNYCIEAVPIAQVAHTKYLGVTISSNLSWNEHVQRITNKAKQVNNFLYHNFRECPILTLNVIVSRLWFVQSLDMLRLLGIPTPC